MNPNLSSITPCSFQGIAASIPPHLCSRCPRYPVYSMCPVCTADTARTSACATRHSRCKLTAYPGSTRLLAHGHDPRFGGEFLVIAVADRDVAAEAFHQHDPRRAGDENALRQPHFVVHARHREGQAVAFRQPRHDAAPGNRIQSFDLGLPRLVVPAVNPETHLHFGEKESA